MKTMRIFWDYYFANDDKLFARTLAGRGVYLRSLQFLVGSLQ